MDARAIARQFYAIHTFAVFIPADIEHEVRVRRKDDRRFDSFRVNRQDWCDATHEAYCAFVHERALSTEIVHGTLGLLRKPTGDRTESEQERSDV